jgi:hypothetical protein
MSSRQRASNKSKLTAAERSKIEKKARAAGMTPLTYLRAEKERLLNELSVKHLKTLNRQIIHFMLHGENSVIDHLADLAGSELGEFGDSLIRNEEAPTVADLLERLEECAGEVHNFIDEYGDDHRIDASFEGIEGVFEAA